MTYDTIKIQNALREAFVEIELDPKNINDAIFHMVDWLNNSYEWSQFCENPESLTPKELSKLILNFLIHVPAHIAAASKLVTDSPVTDVFGVDAVSEG